MFNFMNKNKSQSGANSNTSVQSGDVYIKNDRVPSTFVVDRILDFSPAPLHVRLKEVGGNQRTVTVALQTLKDEHFWHLAEKL